MIDYRPMTGLPNAAGYKPGDVLVLIGELFGRGYANGLADEARRIGMTVIGTTVGRRDSDGTLRSLNADELADAEALLGGKIINVPLEAGFDMESINGGPSFAEKLKKFRPDDWQNLAFPPDEIESARSAGESRFRANMAQVTQELAREIPPGSNVLISHVMAGGFPRARIFMALLNRVFKGTGAKYLPSKLFWESGIGRLCEASFNEVTADTLRYLLEETAVIRECVAASGGEVRYTAFGYHGCAVLVGDKYRWQSYTPYLPGWAKKRLEEIASKAFNDGIMVSVYNCPEIQTNSSALFLGVELSLYPLLAAVRQEAGDAAAMPLYELCRGMLKDGETLELLLERADNYLASPIMSDLLDLESWPQHNTLAQAELMQSASAELMVMHLDQKRLVCAELSRIVFLSTGRLMLHSSWKPSAAVFWLNHDIIARLLADKLGDGIL